MSNKGCLFKRKPLKLSRLYQYKNKEGHKKYIALKQKSKQMGQYAKRRFQFMSKSTVEQSTTIKYLGLGYYFALKFDRLKNLHYKII